MPVPVAAAGISAIGGILGNRRSQSENDALDAQTGLAKQQTLMSKQLSDFAGRQYSLAEPALSAATKYYTTLTQGSRPDINATLAPQYAQVGDIYRGAQRQIEGSSRGATRDVGMADLARSKAEQLAVMPMAARTSAAGSLGSLGTSLAESATGALSGASNAASQGIQGYQTVIGNQNVQRQNWMDLGRSLGNMFIPYLMQRYGAGGGGKGPSSDGFETP